MKVIRKISSTRSAGKLVSAVAMMLLLLFLTCLNQFLYASPGNDINIAWNCDDEQPGPCFPNGPAGPDEKSPDAPVSFNEEYIHDHEMPANPFWANALFTHMIHEADKLTVVHFEILTPPPNA